MEARPELHPLYYQNRRRKQIISKQVLLCPGPVNTSPKVKNALLHPDIGHREVEFSELLDDVRMKLSMVFGVLDQERYTTVVVNGSGSAANEAVISSLGPATRLLVLANGEFGERLAELAECHQIPLSVLRLEWGEAFSIEAIERAILDHDPDMVAMVHHETSTGMLNPIHEVGKLTTKYAKQFYVDAVSSLAADYVDVERNQIDFCTSSANKAIAGMCGLSFVCGKISAFEGLKEVKSRTSYLNLYRHFQYQTELSQTPNTPSLTVLFALDAALDEILATGLANKIGHCRHLAGILREKLKSLGLHFVVPEEQMSNVLTTAYLPEGVVYDELRSRLKDRGYVIYGGKGPLEGMVFQVANIGAVSENHIKDFIHDLRWVLSMLMTASEEITQQRRFDPQMQPLSSISR